MRAAALLILALPAFGFKLTGSIRPNGILNSTSVPLESRLEVDFEKRVPFRADGSFEVEVAPGQHVVRALVPGYEMGGYIVTVPTDEALKAAEAEPVTENAEPDGEATESSEPAEGQVRKLKPENQLHVQTYYPNRQALPVSSASLAYPLQMYAVRKEEYYTGAPSMQIMGLLKSPMVLLMIGTSIMAFFLPRIQASLENDPEMAKDFAEARKRVNSALSGDMGAQLANKLVGDSSPPAPGTPAAAGGGGSATRGGKRGGKRR